MNLNILTKRATKLVGFAALMMIAASAVARTGQEKSLYERMGGIHKIAKFVSMFLDSCNKDETLMKNEHLQMANKNFPAPAVKFLLTAFIANKTGGPQMYSGPNIFQIEKGFMFTPDQMKEDDMIAMDTMKQMGYDEDTQSAFNKWWAEGMASAGDAMEPMPEKIEDKDSLYGRLGGIAPIAVVVDDFVNALASDKTVLGNPNVVKALSDGHVSAEGIKYLVDEQLGQAAGGPWKYSGRTMAESHHGLMITEDEWTATAKILVATLDKYHVPKKEQGEILAVIGSTKGDIVGH